MSQGQGPARRVRQDPNTKGFQCTPAVVFSSLLFVGTGDFPICVVFSNFCSLLTEETPFR